MTFAEVGFVISGTALLSILTFMVVNKRKKQFDECHRKLDEFEMKLKQRRLKKAERRQRMLKREGAKI